MIPKIYPVTGHTDHVGPESTFVAIAGLKQDGTQFIQKAIEHGATKIVADLTQKKHVQEVLEKNKHVEFVFVHNTRQSLAQLSAQSLDYPASKLNIIGITGTKGKTTTVYAIEHALRHAGYKTALLGGIKNKILNQEEKSLLTTPSSDYLQMFFAQCITQKIDYVIMEVSSHALSLERVHGINFTAAGFTNLEQDHLDFYKNTQNYFNAKMLLFDKLKPNTPCVINTDDLFGKKALEKILHKQHQSTNVTCALPVTISQKATPTHSKTPHVSFRIIQNSLAGINLEITHSNKKYLMHNTHMFGEFNAYNLMLAFTLCTQLHIDSQVIAHALESFLGAPGRLQLHTLQNGARAFVDFAHNPSSMEAVLKALRPLNKKTHRYFRMRRR